jgi:hypothetical protein
MTLNKQAFMELGKSFLRAIWFGLLGVVGVFLTSLTTNVDLLTATWSVGELTVPVGVWIVAGVGFVIKALDRYIHQNEDMVLNGLALPPMQSKE